jgi:hypothetical protein
MRTGIYSQQDSKILYESVTKLKPSVVLDLGPREGRTTSLIVKALMECQAPDVHYYLFEKDIPFLQSIKEYCLNQEAKNITFHFHENIIDFDFSNFPQLDLCFIDGNHDYILARWYVETLFPLVKKDGLIHVHDIYYGKNGNGWKDVGQTANPQDHPDIISHDVHMRLYPTIYEKYRKSGPVDIFEEDVVRDYCLSHPELSVFSTCYPPLPTDPSDRVPNCSLYLYNNEHFSFRK